jgi:hypothetical protein
VNEAHPPIVPLALERKVKFLAGEGPKLELKRRGQVRLGVN